MPTGKGKVRPQIHMPEELYARLKDEANARQVTLSDLVVARLEQSYETAEASARKEQTIIERRLEQVSHTQQQMHDFLTSVMTQVVTMKHDPTTPHEAPPPEPRIARYEDMYPELRGSR